MSSSCKWLEAWDCDNDNILSRCSPKDWHDKINRAANIQNIPSLTVTENHDSSPESDNIVQNNEKINANGEKGKKIIFIESWRKTHRTKYFYPKNMNFLIKIYNKLFVLNISIKFNKI